jgi:hypothetical protein
MKVDLIVAGGGLGGCAAALAACSFGLKVVLTEETEWIGGQVTSQGVPPDEHRWIEQFGCTKRYRTYRTLVRDFYRKNMPIKEIYLQDKEFNPGKGLVSKICHDPRVSVFVLYQMLSPYLLSGQIRLLTNTVVKRVKRKGKEIQSIFIKHVRSSKEEEIEGRLFIDATETGELLPLAEVSYVTGAEGKDETGEPHASKEKNPHDIQAFTYVLAMEYRKGEDHTIPEPEMYSFWRQFQPKIWPDKMLSFFAPHPVTLEKREYTLFPDEQHFPLWNYRRIFAAELFQQNGIGDISLMNWPQNDYFLGNVYDVPPEERNRHLYQAKQLSLSLLYWLQTEAPNPNGKLGYPGLKLRKDVFGTDDGFAKAPYIRESRRAICEYTVKEQDVSPDFQKGKTGTLFFDRIGIGSYSIDLHPSMSGRNYIDIQALPFHIPLGALIPMEADNLLLGCKNIGTTHITNGCFRLHPVEWNIGEACGVLAAFCLKHQTSPRNVREYHPFLFQFQDILRQEGFELEWPEEFYS